MADPIFTASYTGVGGGLVIAVADDPGMHSSQNEQDSRHYAEASKLMMLEPSDSGECLSFTKAAYALSEQFDTPVLLRLSTRVSHSQSLIEVSDRENAPLKDYEKNIPKYVMMPANARGRHVVVEERIASLVKFAETTDLNTVTYTDKTVGGKKIGVITAGVSDMYAHEALGDNVSYCKLGMVYPLPVDLLKDFAAKCDEVYVIEELDPFIENHCKALGLNVHGKDVFTLLGEYTPAMIAKAILGEDMPEHASIDMIPGRPPVMCAGCPHRGTFYVLKKLGLTVSGDIGCYTLGAVAPLASVDTTICMGASVSAALGMAKARGDEFAKKLVSVIGDSTFMHSGVTGLIDIVYNKGINTVIILDNSITGMTGHQDNPTTGKTIRGEATRQVDLEALCHACGIEEPRIALNHCSEKVNEKFPHTVGYAEIRQRAEQGEWGKAIVDGPLDVLTAFDTEACKVKGINSAIGGKANALIFPDIEAGNAFYKTLTCFAGAEIAGMLQGAACPVVLSSRGDSPLSKYYSLAMAAASNG
jgi:indolepyruvate ferredoxin oxidoreductase alpha subunit